MFVANRLKIDSGCQVFIVLVSNDTKKKSWYEISSELKSLVQCDFNTMTWDYIYYKKNSTRQFPAKCLSVYLLKKKDYFSSNNNRLIRIADAYYISIWLWKNSSII